MNDPTPDHEPSSDPDPSGPAGTTTLAGAPPAATPGHAARSLRGPLIGLAVLGAIVVVGLAVLFSGRDGTDDDIVAGNITRLVFTNEDGSAGSLADHAGEPVVLNFFASWCAPCVAEMPDIEAAYQSYRTEVTFLGVNADLTEDSWRSFVAETGVSYPTVFQPDNTIWEELGLIGMPSTVLVGPDGQVVYSHTGIVDQATLEDLIDEHLLTDL